MALGTKATSRLTHKIGIDAIEGMRKPIDEMLEKVAELYEQEVNATVDGLTSLLEPLLIVAMGVTVGGMLLAVYLPMFRAVSLIK